MVPQDSHSARPRRMGSSTATSQPALKIRPWHGIHDMAPLEPASSRLVDAIAHEAQLIDAGCVAIDGDLDPKLASPMHIHLIEIEPLRMGIDLQGDIALFGSVEHVLEVDCHRLTLVQ